ncbi:hypothetical protein D3C79_1011420 [compost metagenome]
MHTAKAFPLRLSLEQLADKRTMLLLTALFMQTLKSALSLLDLQVSIAWLRLLAPFTALTKASQTLASRKWKRFAKRLTFLWFFTVVQVSLQITSRNRSPWVLQKST